MPLPIPPRKFSPVKTPVPPVSYTVVVAQDGSGDFFTIQEALNAISASGSLGVIKLRSGTYNFLPVGGIPAGIRIEGEGKDTTVINLLGNLILGNGVELEYLSVKGPYTVSIASFDNALVDVTFESSVVIVYGSERAKIIRSTFNGANVRQIDIISGAYGVIIDQCAFRNYTSEAVRVGGNECIISNCDLHGGFVAPRNIDVTGDRNILMGLQMAGSTAQGIRISGKDNLVYASRNTTVLEVSPAENNRYSQLPGISQSTLLTNGNSLVVEAERFQFYADQMDNPVNSNWAVNGLATAAADSLNPALTVRSFFDGSESGVGFIVRTIPMWGQIRLNMVYRADTAPPVPQVAMMKLYWRSISAAGVVSAWSSMNLSPLSIPVSTNWLSASQYITAGQLGVPDKTPIVLQFEITRLGNDVNDTYGGVLALLSIDVEVF